jgi:hypothetical protein
MRYLVALTVLFGLLLGGLQLARNAVEHATALGDKAGFDRATLQWKAAQDEATKLERAKQAAASAERAKISKEVINALSTIDADTDRRADAIRLRHDAAGAGRLAGGAGMSATGAAASGAIAPPVCDGLDFLTSLSALTELTKLQSQVNAILAWDAAP